MATMNVSLPNPMKDWIDAQIEAGRYSSSSEYVRDLVRRDQEKASDIEALRATLIKAEKSGVSDRSVEDIWTEAEKRHLNRTDG